MHFQMRPKGPEGGADRWRAEIIYWRGGKTNLGNYFLLLHEDFARIRSCQFQNPRNSEARGEIAGKALPLRN